MQTDVHDSVQRWLYDFVTQKIPRGSCFPYSAILTRFTGNSAQFQNTINLSPYNADVALSFDFQYDLKPRGDNAARLRLDHCGDIALATLVAVGSPTRNVPPALLLETKRRLISAGIQNIAPKLYVGVSGPYLLALHLSNLFVLVQKHEAGGLRLLSLSEKDRLRISSSLAPDVNLFFEILQRLKRNGTHWERLVLPYASQMNTLRKR